MRVVLLCLLCAGFSRLEAQTSTSNPANQEILKLVKSGMPESVVVDKIHAAAGNLDTSADALIALKDAGATPAELTAMTRSSSATAVPQESKIMGGVLSRTKTGDPLLQFPEKVTTFFPDGQRSNQALLISFEGKPAIRISAQHLDGYNTDGNLIISNDKVLFNPYLMEYGWSWYPKNGKFVEEKQWVKAAEKSAFIMPRTEVTLNYVSLKKFSTPLPTDRATTFSKKFHAYDIGFHYQALSETSNPDAPSPCRVTSDCESPELEAFVRDLIHNFDGTIAPLLNAARITDVDKQLSSEGHYRLITDNDFEIYAALYQKQFDRMPPPTKQKGGGMAAFSEIAQIASAGATALQQSQAGGNTIQAQQASMVQYNQTVAGIENGTPTPFASSAAATSGSTGQSGAGSSGGGYTGPDSAWVQKMLGLAGAYSCSPAKAPAVPSTFACGRDSRVYSAIQLAWGAECSAETGHPDDAAKDAQVMMSTLREAKGLCVNGQVPAGCTTGAMLSCAALP